jgi:PAS domain S-box-containing protein
MSTGTARQTDGAGDLRVELSRARTTLQNLLERAPLGVHRWDLQADGRLLFAGANPAAARILGFDHAPLLGKPIEEAFPALRTTDIPDLYRRVATTGEPYEHEQVSYSDERVVGVFDIAAFQIEQNRMAVWFRDITERRKVETALRESEARMRSIFRAAPVGIGVVVKRVIVVANQRLCDMVGRTHEELVGQNTRVLYVDAREFERLGQDLQHGLPVPGSSPAETRWRRGDGTVLDVLLSTSPLDDSDRSAGLTFTAADITERKQAEEERRRLEARMLQTQKLESLGVLAGGIAHDFNNILMAILGNADLAQAQISPASPARESLQEIEKASRRAADLCRQMLAYSGRGRFVIRRLDLSELLQEMTHMLGISVSKKALLRVQAAPDLPPVEADVTQIRQVVMNLVVNASEALGEGAGIITVTTGALTCDADYLTTTLADEPIKPGRYVTLEVADTGAGMDEQTRARIFEPFYTTKFTGRGLGLAAVLGIIRGHGGAIKVYSELQRGTMFRVLLPASEGQADPMAPAPAAPAEWHGRGTVLLVDDEESVRTVARKMLEQIGFTVVSAADGQQAVNCLRAAPSDYVCAILDLTMPTMDGEETFRELRRIRPDLRVLLSSGYNEQEATRRFVGRGLAGFIQKPYQLAVLAERLRAVVEGA